MTQLPIAKDVAEQWDEICEAFLSPEPLPNFVVIRDFLDQQYLDMIHTACRHVPLATFCGRMSDEGVSIANEFAEPEEDGVYVTIHQRPSQPMPALERLNLAFGSRDMVKLMAQLYGGMLSDKGHCGVLTCWGPHAFIDPHTDQGTDAEPSRIAIALSLTDGWNPDHGGKTYFQWEDGGRIVCVRPRLNNAIIFATSKDSNHWVEQISGEAPERTRFTWTFSYL